jgi:hypothetical protein
MKELSAFRNVDDTSGKNVVGRQAGNIFPVIEDLSSAGVENARNGTHQRCLAGTIGADNGDDFPGVSFKAHIP